MNIVAFVGAILLGVVIFALSWVIASRLWDDEGAIYLRIIGAILAVVIITVGYFDAFNIAKEHYNVTLKFIDTGNVVCYEDARIVYGDHNSKTLITNDGQRITIVNAEVTVEKVEE